MEEEPEIFFGTSQGRDKSGIKGNIIRKRRGGQEEEELRKYPSFWYNEILPGSKFFFLLYPCFCFLLFYCMVLHCLNLRVVPFPFVFVYLLIPCHYYTLAVELVGCGTSFIGLVGYICGGGIATMEEKGRA